MNIKKITAYLKLIRIEQWVKNLFVFLPLFFDRKLFFLDFFLPTFLVAILFSVVCSAIYCLNDLLDIEADKRHPWKKFRVLPSGTLTLNEAKSLFVVLLTIAIACFIIFNINVYVIAILTSYFILNIVYTLVLKKIAIIDVAVIAIGFVLRILAGAFATGIEVSHWIIIMSFLITLFMALAKRRDDVVILEKTGEKMRLNTNRYSLAYVDTSMSIIAAITIVAYIMYCVSPEVIEHYRTNNLFYTALFVLLGILRYLQIALVDDNSGSPTKILLKDKPMQIIIVMWIVTFMYIIYC